MKRLSICLSLLLWAPLAASAQPNAIVVAATKFIPGVTWKENSIVTGDFSCRGHVEHAILGTNKSEIVIAIFLEALTNPPEVLHYSSKARDQETSELQIEDGDFEPKHFESEVGYIPDGLLPSKTCKGLNLSDGKIDSAHIYWNHNANRFSDWAL